jgi:hypothetical protein
MILIAAGMSERLACELVSTSGMPQLSGAVDYAYEVLSPSMVIAGRRYGSQIRDPRQAWELIYRQTRGDRARGERRPLAEAISADLETWPEGEPLESVPVIFTGPGAHARQTPKPQLCILAPDEYPYGSLIPSESRDIMYDILRRNHMCWLYGSIIARLGMIPCGSVETPDRRSDEIRGRLSPGQRTFIKYEQRRMGDPNAVVLVPGFRSNGKPDPHGIACIDNDRLDEIHAGVSMLAEALYEQHKSLLELLAGGREGANELSEEKQKLMELWVQCWNANSILETLKEKPSQMVQFGQIKVTDMPTRDTIEAIVPDEVDGLSAKLEQYKQQSDEGAVRIGANMLDSWLARLGQRRLVVPFRYG